MRKLLIPIDGHDNKGMQAAVAEAIALHRCQPLLVHLLNVQPAVSGHVAMFFSADGLYALQQEEGREALAPAEALLQAARVAFQSSVVVGRRAENIARAAREGGCDRILLGRNTRSPVADGVLGGLAMQLRHLLGDSSGCQVLRT